MPKAKKKTARVGKQESIKRLKMLAGMMKKHDKIFGAEGHYDISSWGSISTDQDIACLKPGQVMKKLPPKCGSTLCVLGSAAFYKPFNDLGLEARVESFHKEKTSSYTCSNGEETEEKNISVEGTIVPLFGKKTDFEAGAAFFGLSYEQAGQLFSGDGYMGDPNSDDVVDKINEIIAEIKERDTEYAPSYN